jgi:hypothetical protein
MVFDFYSVLFGYHSGAADSAKPSSMSAITIIVLRSLASRLSRFERGLERLWTLVKIKKAQPILLNARYPK